MVTYETDVLVIGTGGAGCRAAIEAKKYVNKVMIISKGPLSKSELTIMTMPGINSCLPGDSDENLNDFYEDTLKGGSYLNNEKLVKVLVKESKDAIMFLEGIGVRFDREENGEYFRAKEETEKTTSSIEMRLDDNMGRTFYNALSGKMAREGIFLKEDIFITNLIFDGNHVLGAYGINIRNSKFIVILAKATILATGGAGGLYSVRTTHPRDTGDGFAMAYRVGADLVNMEFIQSNPAAIIYPDSVKGVITPGWYLLMGVGIKYRNNLDEAFLIKYDPKRREMTTRDIKAKAMHNEIISGRGSEHGGVYLDFSEVKLDIPLKDYLRKKAPFMLDYVRKCGLPPELILEKPLEVGPAAHYTCGGLVINEKTETKIKGLFAAGEVTGGLHGANRLANSAMTDIFVFGKIAGETAAQYSLSKNAFKNNIIQSLIDQEKKSINEKLFHANADVLKPIEVRLKIERIMFEYVGFGRDETGLKKGLNKIEEIQYNDLPKTGSKDYSDIFNFERIQHLELYNMIDTAEMIIRAALARKESRGCQNRTDFPAQDDLNWRRHTLITKNNNEMKISSCSTSYS